MNELALRELALFAGAGGGLLGTHLLGWRPVAAVEIGDYPRRVLLQRQSDGLLPRFPVWDDVSTFDGKPWRGKVDVVSGGFPCQDISAAGKGAGITGERSGLWGEMARIIGEIRPRYVWVENSPLLISRGLGLVLRDLAEMGFSARWGIVGAHHVGAPHKRDRIWILGSNSDNPGLPAREQQTDSSQRAEGRDKARHEPSTLCTPIPHSPGQGLPDGATIPCGRPESPDQPQRPDWWATEPGLDRVVNGLANVLDNP